MGTNEDVKEPTKRIIVQMEELELLRAQNLIGKIQLERERGKVARMQVEAAELSEQLLGQQLKIWEEGYKKKLASDEYTLKKLSIDADKGQAVLDVVMNPKPIADEVVTKKMNGKPEAPSQSEAQ